MNKNTLSLRYAYTHGDINGGGIGGFDLFPAGTTFRYTTHTVQAMDTHRRRSGDFRFPFSLLPE